jgi:N-acetylneuraminate synthase
MESEMRAFIIAEAGVNHNGSLELALRLVDTAADAGADAVKFQTFRAVELATQQAQKADYQLRTTSADEGQFEMIRKLELSEEMHVAIVEHCKKRGIQFLSTPFDSASLRMLIERFGLQTIKLSSGDITNAPLLVDAARSAPHVILSTGMCGLKEVEAALGALAFGFTATESAAPGAAAFGAAYASGTGQQALRDRVTLLHCTTEYPAPLQEVNLRAMDTLAKAFALPVGYSDHTEGIHVAVAAVARGARMLEKHFTLDRTLPGPDHKASLEPDELTQMVTAIRQIETALGDGVKRPTASEWANRQIARKGIVAARAISKGEAFSAGNLAVKRPASGRSPFEYWDLIGRKAKHSYAPDDPVDG